MGTVLWLGSPAGFSGHTLQGLFSWMILEIPNITSRLTLSAQRYLSRPGSSWARLDAACNNRQMVWATGIILSTVLPNRLRTVGLNRNLIVRDIPGIMGLTQNIPAGFQKSGFPRKVIEDACVGVRTSATDS